MGTVVDFLEELRKVPKRADEVSDDLIGHLVAGRISGNMGKLLYYDSGHTIEQLNGDHELVYTLLDPLFTPQSVYPGGRFSYETFTLVATTFFKYLCNIQDVIDTREAFGFDVPAVGSEKYMLHGDLYVRRYPSWRIINYFCDTDAPELQLEAIEDTIREAERSAGLHPVIAAVMINTAIPEYLKAKKLGDLFEGLGDAVSALAGEDDDDDEPPRPRHLRLVE